MAAGSAGEDVAGARARVAALREQVLGDSAVRDTYPVGARGRGTGQRVLLVGGTGYIGRALVPELTARGYTPVVLAREATSGAGIEAEIVVGDAASRSSMDATLAAHPVAAVVSLLSSRRPNDEAECRLVDYDMVTTVIRASVDAGVAQFVHVSDYGVYRPELLPQVYKLRVEGELLGGQLGAIPFTIVRPTSYYPYLAISFADVRAGKPYRLFDHGEWALTNPIAREDLAEFIVNALLDPSSYGRILPVGGPWNSENVVSIRTAGEMMFDVLGKEPQWNVQTLAGWDRKIARIRRMGRVVPSMRPVAYYLEAAKYWSVVNHVAPPYGTRTFREFLLRLKAIDRPYETGSFRSRRKQGSAMIPTDV